MLRARTTSRADVDLAEIWDFIAEENIQKADELIDRIHARFTQLAAMPESGQRCDDLVRGMRRTTLLDYAIYYRITDIDVAILRVAHAARDQASLFD
jgi:toxin ParE1/3/4